ncbi:prolyl oligopeptidase family serine peptidase [uncultured Mucilaginibacter sp.]|uniref:alpha/beta hydrolase family protein n=1 Tax=uncultured Mucilaginibacter sp. TaxID=797541 RepID=UPI0025F32BCF|nr:prolyl oligopeptidase family serine peptidase [uncultured Mucilaginibacter sp.]
MLVSALSCHRKQEQIPVEAFFNAQVSNFHISPNGKYISYFKRDKKKQTLILRNIATGVEDTSVIDQGSRGDHFWTYNNQIVITKYSRKRGGFQLSAIDAATLKTRTLLSIDNERVSFRLLGRSVKHPDILTFIMNQRDSTILDVYRLNITTGELKMYIKNPGNVTQFYTDPDGGIRLEKSSDGVNETILYRQNDNSDFKPILSNNFKNLVEPIAFTGVGNYFYAKSNVNRDKIALVDINADNAKEEKVIFSSDKADIDEVSYSKYKQRLEMVTWQEAKPKRHILDARMNAIYADLEQQLPGDEIRISDRDTTEQNFLINTSSDRNPGSTYLYTAGSKKLVKLADMNPGINQGDLCEMKPISFKAGDGTLINGYLTYPKNTDSVNLPVVVMPHSDFWNRNKWGYNAEVQFLANRGYAVFQVNYRGSTGYGKEFYSAGFKQVGGKMQDDITDGVEWLIAQKIANPKKIAIFGSRFGGFSALYGASFHQSLYACVAVQSPLLNMFTYFSDVPPFLKPKLSMLYEMVGNPETDADQFRAISPIFNANKIKVPLIVFPGPRELNANELATFISEVKKNGVHVTDISGKKNNDSNFLPREHRLDMYKDLEKFLETNLGQK